MISFQAERRLFKSVFRILGVLLRSTFISIVMFLIAFSVVTGEFPPNFGKIKKAYQGMQQLSRLSSNVNHRRFDQKNNLPLYSDPAEQDVADLEYVNRKRTEISQSLFQTQNEAFVSDNSSNEVRALRTQLSEVKIQLYKLQHRVAQLESRQTLIRQTRKSNGN